MTHQIKYNSFTHKVVYLTMSSDQNSISDSATTVQFDTVTGDSGHGVSISSNLITLTGGRHYWGFGCVVINRSSTSDSQYTKFYDSSNNFEAISSPKNTSSRSALGTSIPIVSLPSMTSTILILPTPKDLARSLFKLDT